MSAVAVYSYTDEDLTRFANQVKEVLLAELWCDRTLTYDTAEEHEEFAASYVVAVSRPGLFGKIWDKLNGAENSKRVVVLRSVPPAQKKKAPVVKLVPKEE